MSQPGQDNDLAKQSKEMKVPSQYDNVDYGKKTTIVKRKVSHREQGGSGKFYGSKAILTKEGELKSFKEFLLTEKEDVTLLPERVIAELKKLIRDGAKDLAQNWKDALHLVNTAYHVGNVRRPVPNEKGAWKQYEDLIKHGVKQLAATRGIDGQWRTSTVMVREDEQLNEAPPDLLGGQEQKPQRLRDYAQQSDNHIGKRRFFVEIPGEAAAEIDGKNMDEIIEMISNKCRRHGTKVRVEERTKTYAILTVWLQDVKRDRIVVKEIS